MLLSPSHANPAGYMGLACNWHFASRKYELELLERRLLHACTREYGIFIPRRSWWKLSEDDIGICVDEMSLRYGKSVKFCGRLYITYPGLAHLQILLNRDKIYTMFLDGSGAHSRFPSMIYRS